jgi:hypothetical protein
MRSIRPDKPVKVHVKLKGCTSVPMTIRYTEKRSDEELKRGITEKIEVPDGANYHLYIISTKGRPQDKFEVQEGWTYMISRRARQTQPPEQLSQIPVNKKMQVTFKSDSKSQGRDVEVNADCDEKRSTEEFKKVLQIPPQSPTRLEILNHYGTPQARSTLTTVYSYILTVKSAPGSGRG